MKSTALKTAAIAFLALTAFAVLSGVLSYWTATGHAVIGPDPESVQAQRQAIVASTLWFSGGFGIAAACAVMAFKRSVTRY